MPVSDDTNEVEGVSLAVMAEALYLANLLILPGVAFLLLLLLYRLNVKELPALARAHFSQTLTASIWAGVLLLLVNLLILLLGGYQGMHTWIIVITYFTVCHATLVVFGAYGLAKAMAGQCWRYPLVGRPLPPGCRL